ncbi:MAG: endonuclease MutS2 [Clostridia bacterium]|nr:endonuclease MutS2 [Clostridia bacterium]
MNKSTLTKLEYYKIIEKLKQKCGSQLGKDIAEKLYPETNMELIIKMQKETSEAVLVRRYDGSMPLGGIVDTFDSLGLAEKGGILNPEEIGKVRENLYAAKNIVVFLNRKLQYEIPLLRERGEGIVPLKDLEKEIDGIIDEENQIKDSASDTLWNIRRKKKALNERIKSKLDSIVRNSNSSKYLQESIVTSRQGRYVVPVKIEYRQHVPGIVHDQSSSGATLFIEPAAVVEFNNDLKKLELQEQEEISRILLEISGKIGAQGEILKENLRILSNIDFIMAKGFLSTELEAVEPEINSYQKMKVNKGRHPLIDIKEVVPISFDLGYDFDALIITGPNTGGKTVTIKTAGLFALMAQSGLHLPADKAEMGIFDKVYCDIGDEQSIEQSLSTFSSHMKNIVHIIENTDYKTLVLLDELGAGTDPSEGANLAISIIKFFMKKKAKIIATTHYSDLKIFAYNTERVENASVEFDTVSLRPTYKLLVGIPGKSYALEIAKRLGLNYEIINDAKSMVSDDDQDVSGLIEKLEKDAFYGERNLEETKIKLAHAEAKLLEAEVLKKNLIEREEKIIKKAEEEAYRIIRSAKTEANEKIKEIKELLQQDKEKAMAAANSFRKDLEETEGALYKNITKGSRIQEIITTENLLPGTEVFVPKFNQKGIVSEVMDDEAYVQLGIMKMKLKKSDLTIPKNKDQKKERTGITKIKDEKTMAIKTEIDLRGLTVEEAISEVDKYLDDAKIAGLNSVSLIHGKGTGALRSGLNEFLRGHHFVKTSRIGDSREGGHGVTVVEIK